MSEFAGTLRERIEVWRQSPERNPSGSSSEDMLPVLNCLAAVTADGAGPVSEAMSISAMPRYRMTVRANEALAIDQQVRWKGRRLVIRQIVQDPAYPDRAIVRCEEQR